MSNKIERTIYRLGKFIEKNGVSEIDTPLEITFQATQPGKVKVKWSLTHQKYYDSISEAVEEIENFLIQNRNFKA